MITLYTIEGNEEELEEVKRFKHLFEDEWNSQFHLDEQEVVKQRAKRNRQPKNLPNETEVSRLRQYVVGRIRELMNSKAVNLLKFLSLRRLVNIRLTFLNGRRGGEPSRLLIDDVQQESIRMEPGWREQRHNALQ